MWFGKKETAEMVKGAGGWLDEQQLTKEEQIKYKIQIFSTPGFKIVQRIIVTWVMYVWAAYSATGLLGILLGFVLYVGFDVEHDKAYSLAVMIKEYAMIPFLWTPCLGVFTMYLGGGLGLFKGGKK